MMIPEDMLRQMYLGEMMTLREIGCEIGVSAATVFNRIERCGIKLRGKSESHLKCITKPSKKSLEMMYCIDELSTSDIGHKLCVSPQTISNWLNGYGIEVRTISESHAVNSSIPSEEELHRMYWDNKMSTYEIGHCLGVSYTTIHEWMKRYGIERRSISEALINGDFTGEWSGAWRGGPRQYCYKFNDIFKEAVRERDNYICQLCGFKQDGERLSVHHIHYDTENCYPDVVALCRSCNSRVNGNRDYWEEYFGNQLLERGLYCWSIT